MIKTVSCKKTIEEVFQYINQNDCLFLANVGTNFDYICVNAFIQKLHYELNCQNFSGLVINLRNDPNVGHFFENDAFRFPDYSNVEVITLLGSNNDISLKQKISKYLRLLVKCVIRKKKNSKLYVLTSSHSFKLLSLSRICTERDVYHVFLASGGRVTTLRRRIGLTINDRIFMLMERIIVNGAFPFEPFDYHMKPTKLTPFFRKAIESEQVDIIGNSPNEKYVIFVSQSGVYAAYSHIAYEVLEEIRSLGYRIYIKPHTHERVVHYPQRDEYVILKKGYAVESMVGGAERKPDMIIGFCSTSMFAISAWLDIPCCSLINRIPKSEWTGSDRFTVRCIQSGEYPNLLFYDINQLARNKTNG